ncbi:pseudaminic acid synthase [Ponticoccus alexandrii]|uniref:Pseudaminic acid synthase n=1 Tax=Ponticoccus alexandrii TaxID=1943633 RepID=A0ABX7FG35_9RHOB|nr:pseudaminic acid synthase [Ponticoccus alexandrii]ETA49608.1 N-acetylneuraminate synthase [Rhodobacteraceae bacterium PD-2]QRF68896.1 pseudaminic acid synthase [Ponticoccus alexandrii]
MRHQQTIEIAGRKIGPNEKPYVLAEMSGNHNNDINRALKLIDAAAEAGADGVKLQTYTADTITIDIRTGEFLLDDGGLWHGRTLYDLYQEASTPWEWHEELFAHAKKRGIACFSTPFDPTAVDFLESLDAPAYKIASLELTDVDLIAKVAQTGKPMIISNGMGSMGEIDEAVRVARANGCKDLILLKCTSAYPALPRDANLSTMNVLREAFDCQVGLSDHTMGTHVPIAAVTLGATVIEKHFTLRRADGGVDSAFSLEPEELAQLVRESAEAHEAVGVPTFGSPEAEATSRRSRRSLYVVKDIKAGEVFDDTNIRSIRPGLGLPVKHRPEFMGRTARRDIKRGTPVSWDLF